MSSVHQWFVYANFLLFVSTRLGSCLICYACTEGKGGICKAPNGTRDATEICAKSQVCVKHTLIPAYWIWIPGPDEEIRERMCANESYCEFGKYILEHKYRFQTRRCTTCRSSRCNSATSFENSSFTVAIILLSLHYFL